MVQTSKEYQREYFESENYTIFDNMEAALDAYCERYTRRSRSVAKDSILDDTNGDWVVLNDGSVAVFPEVLKKRK